MSRRVDQSTPRSVALGFQAALIKKDWQRACAYMTQEAQANMLGAILMGAGYATDGDRVASPYLVKVMRKHGLRKPVVLDRSAVNVPPIIRDLMKWSDRHLPAARKLDLADNVVQTEYSDFRIVDDRAYAIATCKGRRSETRFRCIDGQWYLI